MRQKFGRHIKSFLPALCDCMAEMEVFGAVVRFHVISADLEPTAMDENIVPD